MEIGYKLAGLKAGDEVIMPAITFIATMSYPLSIGAKIVFADVDPETINLDPADVARKITPRTKIVDKGIYTRYADVGYSPRCWIYRQHGGTHGEINVSQALKYSCNYFFYEMGYLLQPERLNKYATQLGLGQKTGVELAGEKAGNLAGPESRAAKGGEKWYAADTLMAAIGQSDHQFTPLQLVNYVATLVNGGTRYQPHLLKAVTDYTTGEVYEEVQPTVLNTVSISDASVNAIKEGMKGVVTEDGTASSYFAGFPIQVGGKTGSAQMTNHSATGVFVSFAPYDDPQIAVCVVGEYASSGGSLAPVAIAIYDEYFGLGLDLAN
jgi:penicillin-binding protein 2